MLFYLIGFLVLCAAVAAVLRPRQRRLPGKKPFFTAERLTLLFVCGLLFLVYALQDLHSNGDLMQYADRFNELRHVSVSSFVRNMGNYKDPIYHFTGLLLSKIGFDFYAWKTLIAFVFVCGLYRLLMYHSTNPALSLVVFLALDLFGFSLSGLRQALALGILFFAYPHLKDKHFFRFLILVVLAALFHSTALIFLTAYPIYRLKLRPRNLLFLAAGGVVVLLNAAPLTRLYLQLTGTDESYAYYLEEGSGLNWTGVLIAGCIWLFCVCILYSNRTNRKDPNLCNLSFVAFFMRILATVQVAEFFRISMYFSIFDLLMIADACSCYTEERSVTRFKTGGVALALSGYYFIAQNSNIAEYVFR